MSSTFGESIFFNFCRLLNFNKTLAKISINVISIATKICIRKFSINSNEFYPLILNIFIMKPSLGEAVSLTLFLAAFFYLLVSSLKDMATVKH
jgi:uncharacterized membrane protein